MEKLKNEMLRLMREVYPGLDRVLVFGEGPRGAELMLVGEAPGQQEAMSGRPFVGKAGKNLDGFIEATGLKREDMYITNTVKFRPTRTSDAGRTVNRPPTQEEISMFLPFLKREIDIVSPRVIVTLGNVPLKALMGAEASVGAMHGEPLKYGARLLFPMYHPAALIYDPRLRLIYGADMSKLAKIIYN